MKCNAMAKTVSTDRDSRCPFSYCFFSRRSHEEKFFFSLSIKRQTHAQLDRLNGDKRDICLISPWSCRHMAHKTTDVYSKQQHTGLPDTNCRKRRRRRDSYPQG